jgi:zinc/manganese transport system substrate-binding protein
VQRIIALGVGWAIGFSCLAGTVQGGQIRVLTSFLPLYCFAVNVTGDAAQVDALLSGNANPHDYQLTIKARRRVEAADLVVLQGLGLDAWVEPALRAAKANQRVAVASAGLSNDLIRISGVPNPHIWLDPILAMHCVTNILTSIIEVDPDQASTYRRNASNYVVRLQALDRDIRSALGPYKDRPIVTFHDSFAYFAKRYALRIVAVIEEVPDVSPSARKLARLYATIRETRPKCIFTEPQFPSRLADTIADDLKVPVAMLDTLETGRLDPEAYEKGMRKNLRTLQEKLK